MKGTAAMNVWIRELFETRSGIVIAGAVFLLALVVWETGPFLGLDATERLGLTLLIVAGYLIFLLAGRFRREKHAATLEQSLQRQALEHIVRTHPDRQTQIEGIRIQFEKAIAALKQSKLAGTGNVLYALPWYLLVGPPAAGKSTALLNSGLQFPVLGESGKGVRGVGGTRNCDWWFTNESVFLDTAGRYMTEDEDHDEWLGFLDLLRQYRTRHPINGVLILVSLPDLIEAKDEDLEWHAGRIRTRLDEVTHHLGLVAPVYLVFTKCDLLCGFVEFFEPLQRSERDLPWGCTFPIGPPAKPAHKLFDEEFQILIDRLYARRNATLPSAAGSEKARSIYCFPMQAAWAKTNLSRFVELLFQPSAYQDNPIFRGFYLTSATQEGMPFDKVVRDVSLRAGLPEPTAEPFSASSQKKSYFVKNLFTDVIFPDQSLAGPSAARRQKHRLMAFGVAGGAMVVSALVMALSVYSFLNNRSLHEALSETARQTLNAFSADVRQNSLALEPFRARLDELLVHEEEGPPLRLRAGLYQGGRLSDPSKALYIGIFNRLYLKEAKQWIERQLWTFANTQEGTSKDRDEDYHYSLLKSYLMLTDLTHLDRPFLSQWLQKAWTEQLSLQYGPDGITPEQLAALTREIDLYTRCLAPDGQPIIRKDSAMVAKTQAILQRKAPDARMYARVRREAARRLEPVTLDDLVQGVKQDVLVGTYKIPRLFTRAAWSGEYDDLEKQVVDEAGREVWIVPLPADVPREQLEGQIKRRYFEDYTKAWLKFFESIQVQLGATTEEKARRIQVLAHKDTSPLVAILTSADENTQLLSSLDIAREKLGNRAGGIIPGGQQNPVAGHFSAFHKFVKESGKETQEPPLQQYLMELEKFRTILADMGDRQADGQFAGPISDQLKRVAVLVKDLDREIQSMLMRPFASGQEDEVQRLTLEWKSKIYDPYGPIFAGQYPFRKTTQQGEDMATTKLAEFFNLQGVLWMFYQEKLKHVVKEEGGNWKPQCPSNACMPVSPAFTEMLKNAKQITDALFPQGGMEPKVLFQVKPHPADTKVGHQMVPHITLIVDGARMQFDNGPEVWSPLQWPAAQEGMGEAQLQIQVGPDGRQAKVYSKQYLGRWALFRLLDEAQVTRLKPSEYRMTWKFDVEGGPPIDVYIDFRASSAKDPFSPGLFMNFRLPAGLGRSPA